VDIYVARQPIFDTARAVFAYELLFRSGPENFFRHDDADDASRRVIDNAFHAFGLDALGGGKKLFLNLTRKVLVDELVALFPPQLAVAELLESVEPDPAVLSALRSLKQRGHLVALDDFVFRPGLEELIALADVIKVDFRLTLGAERAQVVERFGRKGLSFLAEKVETHEEFEEARASGYTYFQGYFLSKPQMVATRELAPSKLSRLRLLRALVGEEVDHAELEEVIKADVALSVKLLRYLNSASFGWRSKVSSIKHALALLGDRPLRQWASLVALSLLGEDRPAELLTSSLVRARFCERLAHAAGHKEHAFELFLAGLLSSIDALLGRPLAELLEAMAMPARVRRALLEGEGELAPLYTAARAYERGEWDHPSLRALSQQEAAVAQAWKEALEWAHALA
jgi:c-di-GMP-related signal transduction protein